MPHPKSGARPLQALAGALPLGSACVPLLGGRFRHAIGVDPAARSARRPRACTSVHGPRPVVRSASTNVQPGWTTVPRAGRLCTALVQLSEVRAHACTPGGQPSRERAHSCTPECASADARTRVCTADFQLKILRAQVCKRVFRFQSASADDFPVDIFCTLGRKYSRRAMF